MSEYNYGLRQEIKKLVVLAEESKKPNCFACEFWRNTEVPSVKGICLEPRVVGWIVDAKKPPCSGLAFRPKVIRNGIAKAP